MRDSMVMVRRGMKKGLASNDTQGKLRLQRLDLDNHTRGNRL